MSKFVVNADSLRALERALIGLAVELDDGGEITDQFGYTSTTDDTGSTTGHPGQLNGADGELDNFFAAWQNALAIIGTNIKVLAQQLGAAATEYEQNEQALQQLLIDPLLHPDRLPKVSSQPPFPLSVILGPNGTTSTPGSPGSTGGGTPPAGGTGQKPR